MNEAKFVYEQTLLVHYRWSRFTHILKRCRSLTVELHRRSQFLLPLTFTILWANSADDTLVLFFIVPRKQDWQSCKLQLAWNSRSCFLRKIRKYFKMSSAENFTKLTLIRTTEPINTTIPTNIRQPVRALSKLCLKERSNKIYKVLSLGFIEVVYMTALYF